MSSLEHKAFIWNLIKEIKVGMLVTKEDDKHDSLRGRPMHLVQDDYDGTLYFFTSKDAAKVYEVKEEKKEVAITFADSDEQVYVTLSGKASINKDRELIEELWNSTTDAWFEGGKDDPNVVLLEVKVYKGEHWKTEANKFVQFFEIAQAKDSEDTPNIGENKKFKSQKMEV